MAIWMDLTNSLTVKHRNLAGVIRAELMLAKHLHELYPSIRFSVTLKQGFREVSQNSLNWLWKSENINDDYMRYRKRKRQFFNKLLIKIDKELFKLSYCHKRHHRPKVIPRKEFIVWPYQDGDVVFSCGYIGTQKENYFYRVKNALPNLKLIYTIYDNTLLSDLLDTTRSKSALGFDYLQWLSQNCNSLVYGEEEAQVAAEKYFKSKTLPIPTGFSIKWGNDVVNNRYPKSDILEKAGIKKPFILSVGSFDVKTNYQVLYRAYCLAKMRHIDLPSLVIVEETSSDNDLSTMFAENLLLKDDVKIISASHQDRDTLYKNCLFTVLPATYEGGSFALSESFAYGKLCICSDVPALHRTGGDFARYLDPDHPTEWIKAIADFANHPDKIKTCEQKIKKNWHPITWEQTAETLGKHLEAAAQASKKDKEHAHSKKIDRPDAKIYYDLSLISAPLTGIPRTQMLLARHLYQIRKDIEFFYMNRGNYYYIPVSCIPHLLSEEKIDVAVGKDKMAIRGVEGDIPFKKGSIVFSTGTFFDPKTREELMKRHEENNFTLISTIYDLTPLTVPHTHPKERVDSYPTFLKNICEYSDIIIYGGKTAQKDGENFQKENGLPITPSLAVKWGNDLVSQKHTAKETKDILARCGVTGDYILTVGTVEARKNHKILYDAYLELMRDESMKDKMPQLIICGHPGWKTKDFVNLLKNDERIRDKVIMFSPTDEELDVLYQNCKFTCLASLYEGWSLTLPESLNYGKFCLTADTPSLVETGEDIVDYANPYDPQEWAEKIKYYLTHPEALAKRETLIKEKWHNTTWHDCAEHINEFFVRLDKKEK